MLFDEVANIKNTTTLDVFMLKMIDFYIQENLMPIHVYDPDNDLKSLERLKQHCNKGDEWKYVDMTNYTDFPKFVEEVVLPFLRGDFELLLLDNIDSVHKTPDNEWFESVLHFVHRREEDVPLTYEKIVEGEYSTKKWGYADFNTHHKIVVRSHELPEPRGAAFIISGEMIREDFQSSPFDTFEEYWDDWIGINEHKNNGSMEKKTNKKIDWEERRFELIKAALTGAMAAAPEHNNNFLNAAVANGIVGMAKRVADKMIRSLQKELEETSDKQ